VRRGSKGEEMVARAELIEEGGRTEVAAPTTLRQLEWTGGHRGEVGPLRAVVPRGKQCEGKKGTMVVLGPF
jgi:hypothetical protein